MLHFRVLVSTGKMFILSTPWMHIGGAEVKLQFILTSALVGGSSNSHAGGYTPRVVAQNTRFIKGWVGPSTSLDVVTKTKSPSRNCTLHHSALSVVTILSTIPQLSKLTVLSSQYLSTQSLQLRYVSHDGISCSIPCNRIQCLVLTATLSPLFPSHSHFLTFKNRASYI